jgi:hypothetical protein
MILAIVRHWPNRIVVSHGDCGHRGVRDQKAGGKKVAAATLSGEGSAMNMPRIKSAVIGFLCSVLVGAFVLGVFFALMGAQYSLENPPVIDGKGGPEENTVLGWAFTYFCIGATIGGLLGAIPGVFMFSHRLKTVDPTR